MPKYYVAYVVRLVTQSATWNLSLLQGDYNTRLFYWSVGRSIKLSS